MLDKNIKNNKFANITVKNINAPVNLLNKPAQELPRMANNAARATNSTITATIDYNINYSAGTLSAGQTLFLTLNTNADKKVVLHSACGDGLLYRTRIFYIENNTVYIVEDSQRLFEGFDVDSFIAKGGTYYIQIDITSGSANFNFLVVELGKYSANEPCDNFYDALRLTPSKEIDAADFFDNRMDYDFFALETTEAKEVYLNFAYTADNLISTVTHNPAVGYIVMYVDNSGASIVKSGTLSKTVIDMPIQLNTVGKHIFCLYPIDALPYGQLEENYTFSVSDTKKCMPTVPEGTTFLLGTVQGQIDQGRFAYTSSSIIDYSRASFWINGKSVRLAGTVKKWDGVDNAFKVCVTDKPYENYYTGEVIKLETMGVVNADGKFDVVVPLINKNPDVDSFIYHGEDMHWNYIHFIGIDDTYKMTFIRMNENYYNELKIGVCYNDAPLQKE